MTRSAAEKAKEADAANTVDTNNNNNNNNNNKRSLEEHLSPNKKHKTTPPSLASVCTTNNPLPQKIRGWVCGQRVAFFLYVRILDLRLFGVVYAKIELAARFGNAP